MGEEAPVERSGQGRRGRVSDRLTIWLIAGVAIGGLVCMCAVVGIVAYVRS